MGDEPTSRERLELQGVGFLERYGFPEWVLPVVWFDVPVERKPLEMIGAEWELVSAAFLRLIEALVEGKKDEVLTVGGVLHVYGFLFAAENGDGRFAEPLLKLARRGGEELDELFGEGVTDDFPDWFAELCGDQPDALKALVTDAGLDEFVRSAAFEALLVLAESGRLERAGLEAWVRDLVGSLEREPSYVWCELVDVCVALGLGDTEPALKAALADGLIDKRVFSEAEIARMFAEGPEDEPERRPYRALEVVEMYEERAIEQEERHRPAPVVRERAKVGRNDPCPCGSGKKYKKCCG